MSGENAHRDEHIFGCGFEKERVATAAGLILYRRCDILSTEKEAIESRFAVFVTTAIFLYSFREIIDSFREKSKMISRKMEMCQVRLEAAA